MKPEIYSFSISIVIALLYVGGGRRVGSWLEKEDEPVHADTMVILMGSIADRVSQAADLYQKGLASRVIIVEEIFEVLCLL